MIRSSMPSPLTSPAPATETPLQSYASIPSRRKPLVPSSAARSRLAAKPCGGAEHHIALAGGVPSPDRRMGPDDQIIDAVAVDVPRAGDREAAVVIRVDPVEAEAVGAVERGEIEARREARGGAEDHIALAGSSVRRTPGAPTIRSSMPSPLTSPAPATEMPLSSYVVDPVEAEAVRAVERARDRGSPRSPRRSRTPHSSRRHRLPSDRQPGAPTIRSSMPSPLTSPAPATEQPLTSPRRSRRGGSRWCRRARRDRGSPPKPAAEPNTT